MDGIHDLGGMHGFGPIPVDPKERLFEHRWQRRVLALLGLTLGAGVSNVDKFRHAIERMPPVDYLTAGYYGRWLAALETMVVEEGVTTKEELAAWREALVAGSEPPPTTAHACRAGSPSAVREIEGEPSFAVGQRVRASRNHPSGHTRLPRYARGKVGVVVEVHPAFVFPDANAHDRGEQPQFLYSVSFDGTELWGEDAEGSTRVSVDLFEDYLEPE